jgi:hypothetical protein
MVLAPKGDKVVVGGQFTTVNGTDAYGLAALNSSTGALLPFAAGQDVRNAGENSAIVGLSTDGEKVYGAGFVFGAGGNLEGGFAADPSDGKLLWIHDCHGDHYSTFARGEVFYTVGHAHHCGNVGGFPETYPRTWWRGLAFTSDARGTVAKNTVGRYQNWEGKPAPTLLTWWPTISLGSYTGQYQGGWHVTGTKNYVVIGGEFTKVNGKAQQGLVRFAVKKVAPNKARPRLKGADFVPTLTSRTPGKVTVTWHANWDQDNELLTYKLVRDGVTSSPIYTRRARSTFWKMRSMTFSDTVAPGSTHTYRLYVSDPLGNRVAGDPVTITAN